MSRNNLSASQTTLSVEEHNELLAHMYQVHIIAKRIHARLPEFAVELDDLKSAGTLGLIEAIKRFDPTQNLKLKTYAEYRIRGAILDSLRGLDWAPRELRKEAKAIDAAIERLEQKLQRSPGEEEIAKELGLAIEEYRDLVVEARAVNLTSLESYFFTSNEYGNTNGGLQYYLKDARPTPLEAMEQDLREKLVAEAIEKLPPNKRTVIRLYFEEEWTLRDIAKVLDLHESRISQLKTEAIGTIREYVQTGLALSQQQLPTRHLGSTFSACANLSPERPLTPPFSAAAPAVTAPPGASYRNLCLASWEKKVLSLAYLNGPLTPKELAEKAGLNGPHSASGQKSKALKHLREITSLPLDADNREEVAAALKIVLGQEIGNAQDLPAVNATPAP